MGGLGYQMRLFFFHPLDGKEIIGVINDLFLIYIRKLSIVVYQFSTGNTKDSTKLRVFVEFLRDYADFTAELIRIFYCR